MPQALVSLGSNVRPERHLPAALAALRDHPAITVLAAGGVYRTAPVGPPGQPGFHNSGVLVATDLDPAALRAALRSLEERLGRRRSDDRFAPRTIDLDLIAYEGFRGEVEGAVLPDPEAATLPHLVIPLAEAAPWWVLEPGGDTLAAIAADLDPPPEEVQPIVTKQITPASGSRYAPELEGDPGEVYDADAEERVRQMLLHMGEDPAREGLVRTPLRVAKSMDFLTSGYETSVAEVVNNAIFEADADEMVVVKEIEFYSMCEHHVLPFFGTAAVGYLPNHHIIGLSKIARIVDVFSRRLQVQERLTNQIADAMIEVLDPLGVAVVMEGQHFCMMMRGVQKQGSAMITSAMRGAFRENARTRQEFFDLVRG